MSEHESVTVQQYFEGLVQGFLNMPMEYLNTAIAIICVLLMLAFMHASHSEERDDFWSPVGPFEKLRRSWRGWRYKSSLEDKEGQ